MPVSRTEYAAYLPTPDLIQRDLGGTLTCPIYRNDALVSPHDRDAGAGTNYGTVSIRKPDGSLLVSGAAISVSNSVASYALGPSIIASEPYRMGYRIEWTIYTSATETHNFRNELGIVRCAPHCPISDRDLTARHTNLDRQLAGTGSTTWQTWIDEAWAQIQRWLIQKGNRPQLIFQQSDVMDLAIAWTLRRIFEDLETDADPDGRYARLAERYRNEVAELQKSIHLEYSSTDDTTPDQIRRPLQGMTTLGVSGRTEGYDERYPYGFGYGTGW